MRPLTPPALLLACSAVATSALQAQNTGGVPSVELAFGSLGFSGLHFEVLPDAMARLKDGRILLVGTRTAETSASMAVIRLQPNGTLDTTFGEAGIALAAFGARPARARAVAVQPDSRFVVAGLVDGPSTADEYFAIARFKTDGTLDTSFSGDGLATLDGVASVSGSAFGIAVQLEGGVVVAGTSGERAIALARLQPDG